MKINQLKFQSFLISFNRKYFSSLEIEPSHFVQAGNQLRIPDWNIVLSPAELLTLHLVKAGKQVRIQFSGSRS